MNKRKLPSGLEDPDRTYAANLRIRRLANREFGFGNPNLGKPIPGVRTEACLARKARSRIRRAERKAREAAEALARKSAAEQRQALQSIVTGGVA